MIIKLLVTSFVLNTTKLSNQHTVHIGYYVDWSKYLKVYKNCTQKLYGHKVLISFEQLKI